MTLFLPVCVCARLTLSLSPTVLLLVLGAMAKHARTHTHTHTRAHKLFTLCSTALDATRCARGTDVWRRLCAGRAWVSNPQPHHSFCWRRTQYVAPSVSYRGCRSACALLTRLHGIALPRTLILSLSTSLSLSPSLSLSLSVSVSPPLPPHLLCSWCWDGAVLCAAGRHAAAVVPGPQGSRHGTHHHGLWRRRHLRIHGNGQLRRGRRDRGGRRCKGDLVGGGESLMGGHLIIHAHTHMAPNPKPTLALTTSLPLDLPLCGDACVNYLADEPHQSVSACAGIRRLPR